MPSFKTVDDQTFVAGGEPPTNVRQLIWQGFPGVYIAAAAGGLYKTVDYGATWGILRPNTEFGTAWPGGASGYQASMSIGPRECPDQEAVCDVIPFSFYANWDGAGTDVSAPFTTGSILNDTDASIWYAYNPNFGGQQPTWLGDGIFTLASIGQAFLNYNGDDIEKTILIVVSSRQDEGDPDIPEISSLSVNNIELIKTQLFGINSRLSVFSGIFTDPAVGDYVYATLPEMQEIGVVGAIIMPSTPTNISPSVANIGGSSNEGPTYPINIDLPNSYGSFDHDWFTDQIGGEESGFGAGAIGLLLNHNCSNEIEVLFDISDAGCKASGTPDPITVSGNTEDYPEIPNFWLLGVFVDTGSIDTLQFQTGSGSITLINNNGGLRLYRVDVTTYSGTSFILRLLATASPYSMGMVLFAVLRGNTIVQSGTPTLAAFAANSNVGFQIYGGQGPQDAPINGWGTTQPDYGVTGMCNTSGGGSFSGAGGDFIGTVLVAGSTSGQQTGGANVGGVAVEVGP